MTPHAPKYVSPREQAENRARLRRTLYWMAVGIPAAFAAVAFGYSDQAPAPLRSFTIAVDRALGYPLISLLTTLASR
jgi:hypothetical protein